MGLIEKWNKFALKKIKINDRIEICVGRLIFGTIMFLLAELTTFPLSWSFVLFGVNIKKKKNNERKDPEVNNNSD